MQITRKLIISNTLVSAGATMATQLINLFVLPLFIKNLGAELYGIWVISNVVLGYLNVFDFGFTQGLQKYVAEARAKGDSQELSEVVVSGVGLLALLGFGLGFIVVLGGEAVVSFFTISPVYHSIAVRLLRISGFFCVFMWPLKIGEVLLKASMQIGAFSICNAIKTLSQSLLLFAMVWLEFDIVLMKWITAFSLLLFSFPAVFIARTRFNTLIWDYKYFRVTQIARMSGFSFGMFYLAVIGMMTTQIDGLIIAKFIGMAAVTSYVVATKLNRVFGFVQGLIQSALLPAVYNLSANRDQARIEKLLYYGVRYRMLVMVPLSFIGFVLIEDFIVLWVGEEYSSVAVWGQLFCLVPVLTGLGVANGVARGMGHVKEANLIYTIQVALNVALSLLLLPKYGIGGPILGTVISVALFGDFTLFPFFCRLIEVSPKKTFLMATKITCLGSIMACFTYVLKSFCVIDSWMSLLLFACIAAILYFLLFYIVLFTIEEKRILEKLLAIGGRQDTYRIF